MNFLKDHSKTNLLMAYLVFAISLTVYWLTMAPSICLWDCGENLAASACLGLPHPPGTPLLILFNRAWLVLTSFFHDIGYSFNLIAIFSSAVTVLFIYLIIARGMVYLIGEPDTLWKRLAIYCGGFVGALFCAFGKTFWFAALESSQQSNITNINVVITIWLALVWAQSKSGNRDRLLLLMSYIIFMGIGIRMISSLAMPVMFAFVIFVDPEKRKDWRFWAASIALGLVMYNLSMFLVVVPIAALFFLIMMMTERKNSRNWQFCFWFVLLAIIGFSSHIYLPVRSALNPIIDEGHPVIKSSPEFPYFSLKAVQEVLDRKQYGNESMVSRSLWRRGEFSKQFGIDGHMGFGGFHLLQFFHFDTQDQEKNFIDGSAAGYGKLLIYLIPTLFVLFGFYLVYKRCKKLSTLLILITLLTTLGMVWYMNFADGTRPDSRFEYTSWEKNGKQGPMPTIYREVRVRDYFFSTGFMFFSMWIGLTAGLVLFLLFSDKNRTTRTVAAPLALILFMLSPALPLTQNYAIRDRSDNWSPFEYAYNLLMSCEKDGILFTNGDNDTFPIWAIQEAYGVRRDVRLVNLSLVNTEWFIKQLKKLEPKVPISFSETEIDGLQPQYNPFEQPTRFKLTGAGIEVTIPGREKQQVMRVQDKMVLNIVDATRWTKPIYFATSVSPDNFMGLDPYLQMQGLVYRLFPEPLPEPLRIDTDRMAYLIDSVYKFRTYPARVTDKDEPYIGIATDYAVCFLWYAMHLRDNMEAIEAAINTAKNPAATGKKPAVADTAAIARMQQDLRSLFSDAVDKLDRCITFISWNNQPIVLRHQIIMKFGEPSMAEERLRKLIATDPSNSQLREMLAQALQAQGKEKELQDIMQQGSPQPLPKS
ncbi:MAG: DUF2723 domain-containing protein [Chitinispirillaceae bacterium]|nr:DUF2723 domain-containing protein [Chitinispirillaceae bacterium]